VIATIPVGLEPRACALTPSGDQLFVANYVSGTVSVINPVTRAVTKTMVLGGNPSAIAISDATTPRVFVTRFFAQLIPNGLGEGFDNGKWAVVQSFNVPTATVPNPPIATTFLSPLADSGFTANRKNFCNVSADPDPVKQTFCPDTTITDPASPVITQDPQGVFPNQLKSALLCSGKLYLPNIGAQPEPPVSFDTNLQALVYVVKADVIPPVEQTTLHVNLNAQIKTELPPLPDDPTSLDRLFGNDVVAIDADSTCQNFFIVSRGGNYVIKATPTGTGGKLSIDAPNNVVRLPTGNMPTGIVVNAAGTRAYVNNEINMSVTVFNLETSTVMVNDVASSMLPTPGTFEHSRLIGKLAFYTALGIPDNSLAEKPIWNIDPHQERGKASESAFSSCASCHDGGLADGVTWIFADGPRQTIPLDSLYSKISGSHDTRINNWSAARDSITDFNNNSRNVQCGAGFAGGNPPTACNPASPGEPAPPAIFDHGVSQGISDALDMMTLWAQTIRPLNAPKAALTVLQQGALVFGVHCASCHGGAKWTKSQVIYPNNPTLDKGFAAGGIARDPGLTIVENQIVSYSDTLLDANTLKFLDDVGTFNAAKPIEIRANGKASLGTLGFNSPSLLGVSNNAPFLHDGAAQTLEAVFLVHKLPASSGATIQVKLTATQRTNLLAFLRSLDVKSAIFPSETDTFKDPTQ
jgi:YVTN family beta-propeller protein